MRSISPIRFVVACLVCWFAISDPIQASDGPAVDFDKQIRPLLSNLCVHCHGPDQKKREGDIRLDVKNDVFGIREPFPLITPGNPEESQLWLRLTSTDESEKMPPPSSNQQPTEADLALIKRWIEQGAPWNEHWAFVPPAKAQLPEVGNVWSANSIDPFVLARLRTLNLEPNGRAEDFRILRRLSLDITGLPPTPEEIDEFQNDLRPDKIARAIDKLLASAKFGENMAVEWLDASRYADTNGYQTDATRTSWPWRDWVINSFNSGMPYDQFTRLQIAADKIPDATPEEVVATGFHRNHMLNGEGGRIAEESRVEYVIDRVDATSTVWLGLSFGCCRCHDHKYDPLSQVEFYQLTAFFNSIDESGGVDRGGNANPVISLPSEDQRSRERTLQEQTQKLEKQFAEYLTDERLFQFASEIRRKLADSKNRPAWELLKPTSFKSREGATLELQDDGAIFVSGLNPATDDYELTITVPAGNYTGIRLEALAHSSFTNQGLARSDSGNFVLTDFDVYRTGDAKAESKIRFGKAIASFEQNGHPIVNAFDSDPKSGWAVYTGGDMKADRTAVLQFADAVQVADSGETWIVRLKHNSPHGSHNLGRFRLALTQVVDPTLETKELVPAAIFATLNKADKEWTADEKKAFVEHARKNEAGAYALQVQIEEARKELAELRKSFVETMVLRDRAEPRKTYRLERGVWDKPDTSVEIKPGLPVHISKSTPAEVKDRLDLANWLVSPDNPLPSRVFVNRIWQHFFGVGLVKTAEDFGTQGERPTHPELLDWLARDLIEHDWDSKRLIRQITSSATYLQETTVNSLKLELDPENRMLSRGPRFRLNSHALRDQALFVSGLLVEKVGGPSVLPYQPDGVWEDLTLGKISYQQDHGEKLYRRSLYTFWRRSGGPTMLFDSASRQFCVVRANRTNTPLHALTMMNDVTYVEASRVFAQRVLAESDMSFDSRLKRAFMLALGRVPTAKEFETLQVIANKLTDKYQADASLAEQVIKQGEYPISSEVPVVELAVWTGIANIILNLDEFVTKE